MKYYLKLITLGGIGLLIIVDKGNTGNEPKYGGASETFQQIYKGVNAPVSGSTITQLSTFDSKNW